MEKISSCSCLHAKSPLIVVNMTVFDEALALEITIGKVTWLPNINLVNFMVLAMTSNMGEL